MTTVAPYAGAATLARFALRRDRVRLPVWVLAMGGLVAVQAGQSLELYSEPGALASYEAAARGNAAIIATTGPPVGLDTIGGAVAFELWSTLAVVVALMTMFTVARHTRVDEEADRTELLRSARVGRRAPLAAALAVAAVANLGVLAAVALAGTASGLPAAGSLAFGVGVAGIGLVFAGVTAVAAQVMEHGRAVYGVVAAVLGVSFLLRAAGDIGENGLSWLSPFGWGMAVRPYSEDRWWPLLICLAAASGLVVLAAVLQDRRDLGAGLVRPRPGAARAGRFLGTALGLAWRLQRAALVAWLAGVVVTGVAFGAMAPAVESLVEENPALQTVLEEAAGDVVDAYLVIVLVMLALLAAAYGISSALRARGEEAAGRAEPVLATATGRSAWLGSHLVIALAGSGLLLVLGGASAGGAYALASAEAGRTVELALAGAVYVPAVWLLVAATALLFGAAPRAAAPLAWALLAYCVVMTVLAESFGWPESVRVLSPFEHTPQAPAEVVTAAPLVLLGGLVVALLAAGLGAFRRRDVAT
ncbi:MAG TPA: ABC transporter permease [Jiangellales bacterium]|nr:ABC transporter permease [Jiangellales bacterium]